MRMSLAAAVLGAALAVAAQQPGEITLSGRSFTGNAVAVPVVVTDASGQPIAGLTQADFVVRDNGKQQPLTAFHAFSRAGAEAAPPAPQTRSIALLFDDISTDAQMLDWARRAAADYVEKNGASSDRWAVLTTSGTMHLDFTSDRSAVTAMLNHLATQGTASQAVQLNARAKTDVMHGGGNADEQTEGISAHTLDGISAALAYTARQPGEPVLVFTSTGFPTDFPANGTNLNRQVESLRQAAIRSGVVVSSIDPAAINPNDSSLRWETETNVLSMLANNTGGVMVENRNELDRAYDRLAAGAPVSYLLEVAPGEGKPDDFHHLEVKVNGHPEARVAARPGYYPASGVDDGIAGPPELAKNLMAALAGQPLYQVPVEVKMAALQPSADGPSGVQLGLLISPRNLPFTEVKGKQHETLRVIATLNDAHGNLVVGREGIVELNLSDATRKQLDKTGISAGLALPAPLGVYSLRIIVQETLKGATTALNRSGLRLQQ
ncbi:MAG: VWA domain-containing protein [Terriglobales bacterium]